MTPGVPDEFPTDITDFNFGEPVRMLGFKFPEVPGVPPGVHPARRPRAVGPGRLGDPGQVPEDEWLSSLAALSGELERSDYHLARFRSTLEILKARRAVLGGPVVGDPDTARALYFEAAGYLSAIRTAIDLIVYVIARRKGAPIKAAEKKWSATDVFAPKATDGTPVTRYDCDDVTVLRKYTDWFFALNEYRNVTVREAHVAGGSRAAILSQHEA